MRAPIFEVNAFETGPFTGNPAAVVLLDDWLDDATLQAIARQNNLSETAFVVDEGGALRIRWLTPEAEVDLCGHATLAAAFVVADHAPDFAADARARGTLTTQAVRFDSASGPLSVTRDGARWTLDFPARPARDDVELTTRAAIAHALGAAPVEVYRTPRDFLAVFATEAQVAALRPDFGAMRSIDVEGIIATAPGNDTDLVSRFFAPRLGIDEDPVTGSAHCTLVPYWAARLGQRALVARQLSARGGRLWCTDAGARVHIAGRARLYLRGEILLADAVALQ